MLAGKFSKFRAHLVAVGMAIGITTVAYGTFQVAMMIKMLTCAGRKTLVNARMSKWTHATPRLLHEEMDYFLYHKEQEARMKALKEAKAQ